MPAKYKDIKILLLCFLGLMDIALLSANANQLRFLITYNHAASTFYCSLALVILSLVLQMLVGIVLIFKVSANLFSDIWVYINVF